MGAPAMNRAERRRLEREAGRRGAKSKRNGVPRAAPAVKPPPNVNGALERLRRMNIAVVGRR